MKIGRGGGEAERWLVPLTLLLGACMNGDAENDADVDALLPAPVLIGIGIGAGAFVGGESVEKLTLLPGAGERLDALIPPVWIGSDDVGFGLGVCGCGCEWARESEGRRPGDIERPPPTPEDVSLLFRWR